MTNLKKRTIASVTALILAVSLSACDTVDDPNDGTTGGTDDVGIVTTTLVPLPTTAAP
ncbi:MAG TPA: hypothetical protein VK969_03490 [Acidimicrobiia bacterium]|nr:hypothetical protein [Acidimicrobiia bacterium]